MDAKFSVKRSKEVQIRVSQYEGLRFKDVLKHAEHEIEIAEYILKYDSNKELNCD